MESRPIWYDEAFSILFAQKGPAAVLAGTLAQGAGAAAEEHPPAFYLLLWAWMRAFGTSLPAVRLPEILAGAGSVALIYFCMRELFDGRTAALAALFAALSPFQIHYAQEVRMYAWLGFWLMLATFAYLRGSRRGGWKWWALFGVAAALAQYTHNLAALYLAPLALTPLWHKDWRSLRSVALGTLLAVLLYLPWLLQLPSQVAKLAQAYWITPPGAEKLLTLLMVYTTDLPVPAAWLPVAFFIALAAFAIGLVQMVRMLRRDKPGFRKGAWLFYLAFAPPLLSLLISGWQPIFLERTFLASGMIFCAWLSWALFSSGLPRPVAILMGILLLAGAGLGTYQHLSYMGFPYAPFQNLTASLERQVQAGDVIVHSNKLSLLPSLYFDPGLDQVYILDAPGSSTDTLAPETRAVLGVQAQEDIQAAAQGAKRIWLIIFDESIQEYLDAGQPAHPQLSWLDTHYHLDHMEAWGDLRVYLYRQ